MFTVKSIFSLIFALAAIFFFNIHVLININENKPIINYNNSNTTTKNLKSFYNLSDTSKGYFHPSNYYFWHSLWHVFIFLTAGLICHTRLYFDNIIYPSNINRTRTSSNSL